MKISKKDFLKILIENQGLFAKTAKMIKIKYDIDISRQAVVKRANRYPEILEQIEETNLDVAESGLYGLMLSKDERVQMRAIEFYLETKGKKRGFIKGSQIDFRDTTPKLVIDLEQKSSIDNLP